MSDASPSASDLYLSPVHRTILNLANCDTEKDLINELNIIINSIQFDWFCYSANFSQHNNNTSRRLSNVPASWRGRYFWPDDTRSDPVLQMAHHRLTPMMWEELRCVCAGGNAASLETDDGEIGDGIAFPIHSKNGDTAVLGFFIRGDRSDTEQTIDLSLGEMSLTATYCHDAMIRIIAKSHWAPKAPLTHREIECLQLIANYKSNWVISRILGISEHGVVYYVRRLMWKLDAQNRYQAVERATACGLI